MKPGIGDADPIAVEWSNGLLEILSGCEEGTVRDDGTAGLRGKLQAIQFNCLS